MNRILTLLFSLMALCQSAWAINLSWEGRMGEKIRFRLDVQINDDDHIGGQTTYYRNNGQTSVIPVVGQGGVIDDRLIMTLTEHLGKKICGYYFIELAKDGSIVEGQWSFREREYDLLGMERVEASEQTFLHPIDVADASGVYQFTQATGNPNMPEYGGTAQLYAEGNNLAYNFCQVTPNIAEVQNTTSEVWQSRFYITKAPAFYDVVTYQECVIVNRSNPDAGMPDDFGMGADLVGIYFRTDEQLDGELVHSFDAEHEFSQSMPCTVFEFNEAWHDAVDGETTFPDEISVLDLDGDDIPEILGHYTEGRTEGYEVSNHRWAIFTCASGEPQLIAKCEGSLEAITVEGPWVVLTKGNRRGTTITHTYYKMSHGSIVMEAEYTEADIKNYTINGKTVTEKEFKKQVPVRNDQPIETLGEWREVPGNVYRNEHAARG